MHTRNQQIRIDELSENVVEWVENGSSDYPHSNQCVHIYAYSPNTRPICELYFQYIRVLIFLLMRFLSIFYRIEHCASVCVQVRLFSISFIRMDFRSGIRCCCCCCLFLLYFFIITFVRSLVVHSSFIHSWVPICMDLSVCVWMWLSLLLPFFAIACLPLFLFFFHRGRCRCCRHRRRLVVLLVVQRERASVSCVRRFLCMEIDSL